MVTAVPAASLAALTRSRKAATAACRARPNDTVCGEPIAGPPAGFRIGRRLTIIAYWRYSHGKGRSLLLSLRKRGRVGFPSRVKKRWPALAVGQPRQSA